MNREEAARILDPSTIDLEFEKDVSHWSERLDLAMTMGAEALRSRWVKTADRLPTEADADDEGKVTALITGSITGKLLSLSLYYKSVTADSADYFLPLPKLPEVEG